MSPSPTLRLTFDQHSIDLPLQPGVTDSGAVLQLLNDMKATVLPILDALNPSPTDVISAMLALTAGFALSAPAESGALDALRIELAHLSSNLPVAPSAD
jgi:hypothetical protein